MESYQSENAEALSPISYPLETPEALKNKVQAIQFLKNKYKHLKNLKEFYGCKLDNDFLSSVNDDVFNKLKDGETVYNIDYGSNSCSHTTTFVYGKIDNAPFIMYFDYPAENQCIGFSKIKDNDKAKKVILPLIQADGRTCFIFQSKMLQTMTPEVICNLVKTGQQTTHKYKTEWIVEDIKTRKGAYHIFEYPAIHVPLEKLPEGLLTYMQSIKKMQKVSNGKIFEDNAQRDFIQPRRVDGEVKVVNLKACQKMEKLYGSYDASDGFFEDLYSTKNSTAGKKHKDVVSCGCGIQ